MPGRRRRLLRRLHGDRRMVGERDEHVQLLVGRTPAAERLVDGEDAEQVAVVVAHRHEESVERMPAVRARAGRDVGDVAFAVRPVELAGLQEVGAAPREVLREQRLPLLDRANVTDQRLARLGPAVDGRDVEVVPRRPMEVDRDRRVPERFRDHPRDRREQLGKVVALANERRDLDEAAQRRDGWKRRLSQGRRSSRVHRVHRHAARPPLGT